MKRYLLGLGLLGAMVAAGPAVPPAGFETTAAVVGADAVNELHTGGGKRPKPHRWHRGHKY